MKSHHVLSFILLAMTAVVWGADAEREPSGDLPDLSAPPPQNKPIEYQTTEEGEERTFALQSSYRARHIYPSNWGTAGIFRVRSAESLPEGALTFGVGGEFYSISNSPTPVYGTDAKTIAEMIFVGYAPIKDLTISAMRRSSSTTVNGPPQRLVSSLGDFNVSAMYSFPLSESFAVAPIGNFLVASNFNDLAPTGNTVSAGIGGALTYSLWPTTGQPLLLHANVIYHMPQIRGAVLPGIQAETYFNFSRYHTMTLGLAAEYTIGDFIPFLEFHDQWQASSGLGFGNSPSRLSFGSRFMPLSNKSLALLLGADVGVGKSLFPGVPFNPAYQIIGQISYTVGVSQTERKHYATTKDVNVVDRKFILRKSINFKIASAELEPSSSQLLDQIAKVIIDNKVHKMMIIGHTDSSHGDDYNLKLSLDRANSVKRYLGGKGIAEETLITQGYGKRRPRATNATETGRALNRRVEFYIID